MLSKETYYEIYHPIRGMIKEFDSEEQAQERLFHEQVTTSGGWELKIRKVDVDKKYSTI